MAKQKLGKRGAAVILLVVLVGGSSGATATAGYDDQGLVASWAEE